MPENPHVAVRELGMTPTGTSDALANEIFHTGQGDVPDPPVYKFPRPSPVSPSIALGVVISVVKVAFCGNWGLSAAQAHTQPKERYNAYNNIVTMLFPVILHTPIVHFPAGFAHREPSYARSSQ
jgi:hypothetical protein